jgi:hypothetical protein
VDVLRMSALHSSAEAGIDPNRELINDLGDYEVFTGTETLAGGQSTSAIILKRSCQRSKPWSMKSMFGFLPFRMQLRGCAHS